ncbi:Thioredoxin-like [Sphingobacterium nematocida]|uniref:Thioredoxin-like n=2 Tax=Sphingobacterium nematocida TaxID=1513896 RepID=A0A1T5AVD9_9SPHI|nr:Thioredoxin-like [Sphingobacterium nematocida]
MKATLHIYILLIFILLGESSKGQVLDSTGAQEAITVFKQEQSLRGKLKLFEEFKRNEKYQKSDRYTMFVESMMRDIAVKHAALGDLKNFEIWADKVTWPYIHGYALKDGFEVLVKMNNSPKVRSRLKARLNLLVAKQPWEVPTVGLFTGLMHLYQGTLSKKEELKMLPYLTALYNHQHYFPTDAAKISGENPMPFTASFTYQYAKCLAAAQKIDASIQILLQGLEMELFTLDQITCQSADFKNITDISAHLTNILATKEGDFKANVFKLLSKPTQKGITLDFARRPPRYMVLDFWGSWCIPCRQTHPKLQELYTKYQPKGLEIISISKEITKDLDEAKKAWINAITHDGMTWPQMLNNEWQDFDAIKAFTVGIFPTKILVDTKTWKRIGIYKGMEGSLELEKKIETLFK